MGTRVLLPRSVLVVNDGFGWSEAIAAVAALVAVVSWFDARRRAIKAEEAAVRAEGREAARYVASFVLTLRPPAPAGPVLRLTNVGLGRANSITVVFTFDPESSRFGAVSIDTLAGDGGRFDVTLAGATATELREWVGNPEQHRAQVTWVSLLGEEAAANIPAIGAQNRDRRGLPWRPHA